MNTHHKEAVAAVVKQEEMVEALEEGNKKLLEQLFVISKYFLDTVSLYYFNVYVLEMIDSYQNLDSLKLS